MGDVSLGIRDMGYYLPRHLVGDNTLGAASEVEAF